MSNAELLFVGAFALLALPTLVRVGAWLWAAGVLALGLLLSVFEDKR